MNEEEKEEEKNEEREEGGDRLIEPARVPPCQRDIETSRDREREREEKNLFRCFFSSCYGSFLANICRRMDFLPANGSVAFNVQILVAFCRRASARCIFIGLVSTLGVRRPCPELLAALFIQIDLNERQFRHARGSSFCKSPPSRIQCFELQCV